MGDDVAVGNDPVALATGPGAVWDVDQDDGTLARIDPRSANLNTEMGILVESTELAEQLRAQFERTTGPEISYRVVLEEDEGLVWYDRVEGKDRRLEREPDASAGRRLTVTLLRLVPIESQL